MRRVALVLISLFLLSIVPGLAIAQESVWSRMDPAAGPSARLSHDIAYDSESDRTIIFGGENHVIGVRNDETWAYDLNTDAWRRMNPSTGPGDRIFHAMAYDIESDRVLFGGMPSAETWTYHYNTDTWTNMSPAISPPAWVFVRMAYDRESDRIVLFGGGTVASFTPPQSSLRDETWAYDFDSNTWTNMTSNPAPAPRALHSMAYDSNSDKIVLFGGRDQFGNVDAKTWVYDLGSNTWTPQSPETAPLRRHGSAMSYDAGADRVLLFGGTPGGKETWAYNLPGDTWTRLEPSLAPSVRQGSAMAYDDESGLTVLFGGCPTIPQCPEGDETWSHRFVSPPLSDLTLAFIAVGVVVAAVVSGVAVFLTRRRKRMREGEGGE